MTYEESGEEIEEEIVDEEMKDEGEMEDDGDKDDDNEREPGNLGKEDDEDFSKDRGPESSRDPQPEGFGSQGAGPSSSKRLRTAFRWSSGLGHAVLLYVCHLAANVPLGT